MNNKIVLTVLCCLVSLIEPAFAQAQFPYTGRVKADRVAIRAGQHLNFETVAVVNKRDTLVVLAQSYGWLRVKLPAGAKAFVKTENVFLLTPDLGEVKVDKINIRVGPSTDAEILGKLAQGRRFFIRENRGEWLWIKPVDDISGWIKEEWVERTTEPVPARLYPEPQGGVLPAGNVVPQPVQPVVPVPEPKVDPKPEPKPEPRKDLLKHLERNKVEAVGKLEKVEDDGRFYVIRDGQVVCRLDAPPSLLKNFLHMNVRVRGTLKKEPEAKPAAGTVVPDPVVIVSKIQLSV